MSTPLAQLPNVTLVQVEKFKRQAKDLKKELGIKHTAALDAIAQREGFTSWPRLLAKAGGQEAVLAHKRRQHDEGRAS